jgi:hypothetical protein
MSNMLTLRPEVDTGTVVVKVPPRQVTGRYLAHARLTPTERAFLAADIVDGRAVVVDLTATQVARILRTNATYVAAASKLTHAERRAVRYGLRPLIARKPEQLPLPMPAMSAAPTTISLAEAWVAASDDERTAFVEEVGIDPIWDALEPAI